MRESVLRDYFLELVDESQLSDDLANSDVKTSYDVTTYNITYDLSEDFEVTSNILLVFVMLFFTEPNY